MSKAVRYSEYGGPEVLQWVEVEEPHAAEGHVRVAVRAAGMNPFDSKVRRGGYIPGHTLPAGQGAEFAGVVDEIGEGVTDFAVGDEVLGWANTGAQAEFVVVPPSNLTRKPAELDWATASAIGLVSNTAKRAVDSLELGPSDTVLVTAAAGGVGIPTVQFARATGATVVGTASESNHEFLESLGVIPVAYGDGEVERLRAAAPSGYTAVLDNKGGDALLTALELEVAPARINTIADRATAAEHGLTTVGGGGKTAQELAEFARQVVAGELVIPVRKSYPVTEVAEAYRDLDTGHGRGKLVLTFD
ncbi:MAG: NADP-dependent oxidoreductase [Cryobacterium sp.]|nr:NADP-dependent oxidoreductase [Cryobacterium sp.]